MFFRFGNKNRTVDKIKTQDMKATKGKDIVARTYPKVDATKEKVRVTLDEKLTQQSMVNIDVGTLYCHWQKVFNEFFPFPKPILDNSRIEVIAQKEGVFFNDAVMDDMEPVIVNLYLKDPVSGIERCATLTGLACEFLTNATNYIYGSPYETADGDTATMFERYELSDFFTPYGVWNRIVESVPYRVNYTDGVDYLRKEELLGCSKETAERELDKYTHNVELFNAVWENLFPPGKENEFLNEALDEINTIANDMSGALWNYDHPTDSGQCNNGYITRRKGLLTEKHWIEVEDYKRSFPEVEEYVK